MTIRRFALLAFLTIAACGNEPPAQQPAPPSPAKTETPSVASSAPAPVAPPGPKLSMPEMQKKTLLATLNERNPDRLYPYYTLDAVKRIPMPDGWKEIRGDEAIARQMDDINDKAGPTVTWTRARVLLKNEFSIAEYIVSGTTKDGKKLGVRGLVINAFDAQGKIKREDVYIDRPSILIQTGRTPGKSEPAADPIGETVWIVAKNEPAEEKHLDLLKSKWPDAWQKKDKKAFEAMLTDDYVQDDIAWGATVKGRSEAGKGMEAFTKAVPDVTITVDESWAVGDVVIAAMTMKGTQKGPLATMKPTNKSFTIHLVNVADVKDGKLAKSTIYMNSMEMLGQLGLWKAEDKPRTEEKK